MVDTTKFPIKTKTYLDSIKNINQFLENGRLVFSRFGDACFIMMIPESDGTVVGRSNRQEINSDVRKLIYDSFDLNGSDVLIGLPINIPGEEDRIGVNVPLENIVLKERFSINHDNDYIAWTALEYAYFNYKNEILKFFNLIRNKKTIWVGQYYENILNYYYGDIVAHVETSGTNSLNSVNKIVEDILNVSNGLVFDQIIFSAGQAARVAIYQLYNVFLDKNLIDVGSLTDRLIVDTESFKHIVQRNDIKNNRLNLGALNDFYIENMK